MKTKTLNKKIDVIIIILSILVVILSTAFYRQGRRLSELKKEFNVKNMAEKSKTIIEANGNSSVKNLSQDDEEVYKNKIKKLETTITAMQKRQDRLEKILYEYDENVDSPASNRTEISTVSPDNYSRVFKDFIEENNYHPEIEKKLIDLFVKRDNALGEYFIDLQNARFGNTKANLEKFRQRPGPEEIKAEFDEKMADLLSEEGLAALKEYENTDRERSFIKDFQKTLGDDKLEKEKVKELVTLMYNLRQAIIEEQRKTYENIGSRPDKETMERRQMDSLESTKKIYEGYASLVEGFLSESQMQKFRGYVNMRKEFLMSSNIIVSNNEKEKDE